MSRGEPGFTRERNLCRGAAPHGLDGRNGPAAQDQASQQSAAPKVAIYSKLAANAAVVLSGVACSLLERQVAAQATIFWCRAVLRNGSTLCTRHSAADCPCRPGHRPGALYPTNSQRVATFGLSVSDPPTQSEMQTIANKLDELIAALRRQEIGRKERFVGRGEIT